MVSKGTFAWAVAQLAKGHVLKREDNGTIKHYMTSPHELSFRVNYKDGTWSDWLVWTPSHADFVADDWELL